VGDEGPFILIVENDDGLRSDYRTWLVEEGLRVLVAANGLEALELSRMHRPSLILMNLDLPGLDGWEATRVLRRDPRLQTIRVVALTSRAAKMRDSDGRSAGCNAALRTPIRRQALIAVVRRFVPETAHDSLVRLQSPAPHAPVARHWLMLGRKRT
jgi:CheY-like chemotaxis protein